MNESSAQPSQNDKLTEQKERNISDDQSFLERIEKALKEFKDFNKKAKEFIKSARKRNMEK